MWRQLNLDSAITMAEYTVLCILEGSEAPFSLKTEHDTRICLLKEQIFEKNRNKLKGIDAVDLKLYQVDIQVPKEKIKEAVEEKIQRLGDEGDLDAMLELSQVYSTGLPEGVIHIAALSRYHANGRPVVSR